MVDWGGISEQTEEQRRLAEAVNLRVIPTEPHELDFAWYEEIRAQLVRNAVGSARRVLDVGCGRGQILLTLAGQIGHGVGIDIDAGELAQAEYSRKEQKITNVGYQQANALALPFPDCVFDVILLLGDVLTYPSVYGRHPRVVAELRRVLETGGISVHGSMNWEWEYNAYPPVNVSFTRTASTSFCFHRGKRTCSGSETVRDYDVVPDSPLYRWLVAQDWPVSPQGFDTSLDVKEEEPIATKWLNFRGISRYKHYRPEELKRLYTTAGFRQTDVFAYGQIYDVVAKAGLLHQIAALQSQLAKAEAELASTLGLGCGPWLFLVARK
jgi:SAM-dependent methyltransferase